MVNWFEIIANDLADIRKSQNELRDLLAQKTNTVDADPFGDFNWLVNTCSGIPASTLRIKSAAGLIPGVVKFGKRVLYEKSAVLNWLRGQTRQAVDMGTIEKNADLQVNAQLHKRSLKKGVGL